MQSNLDPVAEPAQEPAPVVYEQPLNERMRSFLRLEFLYTQATYHSEMPNAWSARAAVASILEILAITARGDSRSDVLKELERHMNLLREYQTKSGWTLVASSRCLQTSCNYGTSFPASAAISWHPSATRNS